jgi:hypothetical protein
MRFMTLVKSSEKSGPPPKELIDAIARLAEEGTKSGLLIETGGLTPAPLGARVRISGGKLVVTDGPYAEAKEVIGGYAVLEVKSKAEAIEQTVRFMELHRKHWPGWEGETEIRQMFDGADFPQECGRP